jgi:hypothetical protein
MARFSEETLNNWRKPPSDTEGEKLSNAEKMVRDAIKGHFSLQNVDVNIFGQGSYANDTNVRLNSDIDINVQYQNAFHFDLPPNTNRYQFELNNPVPFSAKAFKDDVQNALINKFGRDITRKNKCIGIEGNTYRVGADVVPTWPYKRFSMNGTFVDGVCFVADTGEKVVNFPVQHIKNGKSKNLRTHRRFKRLTRIFKRLRASMIKDGQSVDPNITSFLLECLLWNVPDWIFNEYDTWTERLKYSIVYLWDKTMIEDDCKTWTEVSEMLYLFHGARKWSRPEVNLYLANLWEYLEYS